MMKNKVMILQDGYCKEKSDKTFTADCTVSLITGINPPILVDTSGPWNRDNLILLLQKQGYKCEDIQTVVCTHGHSDHIGNLNLFPHAKFIVGFDIFRGNVYQEFNFQCREAKYPLGQDVFLIPTPGHTNADISVVVRNTELGTVVIAGDIFENENDLTEPSIWQSLSENIAAQKESRKLILLLADYVVPGHGKMFKVSSYNVDD